MAFTKTAVAVKQLDQDTWELLEPVVYNGKQDQFMVPAGFRTDFASVPHLLTWLVPRYGIYTKSAILHDFLYSHPGVGRADADGIFRRTMKELEVPFLRRWMMWGSVRAFGSGLAQVRIRDLPVLAAILVLSLVLLLIPVAVVIIALLALWVLEACFYVIFAITKRIRGDSRRTIKPDLFGPLTNN